MTVEPTVQHEETLSETAYDAVPLATTETREETGALGTLGIDGGIFVAQLVNFLIVLLVLWRFAYRPLVAMLDQRSERIEKSMRDAEHVERRVAALEGEREQVLADARAESAKLMEMARADAESLRADLVEKAKREVERVVVLGKAQLKAEQESMVREARREIADIAVAAAKKILADSIDEKKARSLAEEVARKMT